MSKVILHIGTHKTATTTIQDTFWKNSSLLAEHGIIYPRLSKITGHHGLVFDWGTLPEVYRLKQGSREAFREIANTYAGGQGTVFLSSEEFSRGDPKGAVDFVEVRELLAPFDEIEVVCVLRPQWQFIQSVYLELSKKMMPPRPPVFVQNSIKSGMVAGLWADYNGLLDRLEMAFRPEEITFMDFRKSASVPGGIIGTMLAHMGSDLSVDQLEVVNGGASNVSPMSLASWSANLMSEPKVAPTWIVDKAARVIRDEFGTDVKPCLFTRDEFRSLKNHFGACNEVLHKRRAKVQPDFALSPTTADGLTLFRDDLNQSFWLRTCRSLVADRMRG